MIDYRPPPHHHPPNNNNKKLKRKRKKQTGLWVTQKQVSDTQAIKAPGFKNSIQHSNKQF